MVILGSLGLKVRKGVLHAAEGKGHDTNYESEDTLAQSKPSTYVSRLRRLDGMAWFLLLDLLYEAPTSNQGVNGF